MVITWDHPEAIKLREGIVKGLIEDMEEMANTPKEELGKRQPGEVNSYELSNYLRSVEKVKLNIEEFNNSNNSNYYVPAEALLGFLYKRGYAVRDRNGNPVSRGSTAV